MMINWNFNDDGGQKGNTQIVKINLFVVLKQFEYFEFHFRVDR